MSVSVKLEACGCKVDQVELSLLKNQPEGPCMVRQEQGDGTESINLQGMATGAGESYQVALAAYCEQASSDPDGRNSECCVDLRACMGESCSSNSPVCEACNSTLQACAEILPNLSWQQFFFEKLMPLLDPYCSISVGEIHPCCAAMGSCTQSAWTSCASDQCGSCTAAILECQLIYGQFDPAAMSSDELMRLLISTCINANSEVSACCRLSEQCLQETLSPCEDILVGTSTCPSCERSVTSCGEATMTEDITPASARALYSKLCGEEPPPDQPKGCVACYAMEPLPLTAGETTLEVKASSECEPLAITELKELPACTAE